MGWRLPRILRSLQRSVIRTDDCGQQVANAGWWRPPLMTKHGLLACKSHGRTHGNDVNPSYIRCGNNNEWRVPDDPERGLRPQLTWVYRIKPRYSTRNSHEIRTLHIANCSPHSFLHSKEERGLIWLVNLWQGSIIWTDVLNEKYCPVVGPPPWIWYSQRYKRFLYYTLHSSPYKLCGCVSFSYMTRHDMGIRAVKRLIFWWMTCPGYVDQPTNYTANGKKKKKKKGKVYSL